MTCSPLTRLKPKLRLSSVLPLAFSSAALACSAPDPAHSGGANGAESTNQPEGVDENGNACTAEPGPGVVRRLTTPEYVASLRHLLGADVPAGDPLTGNTVDGGYSTNAAGLWVRDLTAQAIENHATQTGEWVAATDPSRVTSCAELTEACAETTVRSFGRRAYRAALTDEQVSRHTAAFMAGDTFDEALALVVSSLLQSPYFLYRSELGAGTDAAVRLNNYELGTALSYFLTDSPPDGELSALIDAGQLDDEETWNAQVERLLALPEVEQKLVHFVIEWLDLDKVLTMTKTEADFEVPDSLRASMLGEVEVLVRHVIQTEGGVSDLLSNESLFLNGELATHYRIAGPTGETFEQVPAGDRTGGLLGTGAYLLGHSTVDSSSPTLRGVFIRERLLCQHVEPPPPSVDTDLPPLTGTLTTRQRYSEHLASPVCSTCHKDIDPLGHAFENFDGLGRHRTQENGIDVDTTGTTVGFDSGEVPFANADELTAMLAQSDQVERCFHQNLTEFIVGQESWDNLCSVNAAVTLSRRSGGSLKDSLRAILSLPHMKARLAQGAL